MYVYARPSYFRQLNTVHHSELRLCLGAFCTSPVDSLYTEAYEPWTYSRSTAAPSNPAYRPNCVFNPSLTTCFETLLYIVIRPFVN